jgi:acylphosphatase
MSGRSSSLHVRVTGRVQGVGFRWYVRETARRGDLAGWVRNNPDGSVELYAAGDAECIVRLRRAIATGPEGSQVEAVVPVDEAGAPDAELPHPFVLLR